MLLELCLVSFGSEDRAFEAKNGERERESVVSSISKAIVMTVYSSVFTRMSFEPVCMTCREENLKIPHTHAHTMQETLYYCNIVDV